MENNTVSVRIQRPVLALQSYVTFFYFIESDGPLVDFLYPEWGNVRFELRGKWTVQMPGFDLYEPQDCVLYGPTDRHGRVETPGGKAFGFGLTPIGWHRLIGGNVSQMANRIAPLGQHLGCDGEQLRRALIGDNREEDSIARIETLLIERLAQQPETTSQVLAADRALRRRPLTVEQFAADAGMSERSLHRLCLQTFGFPPKRLMRLQRFLDALGQVRSAVGGEVGDSLSEDYFDQSHFYRDFRDFMAMSAKTYFTTPRPLMAPAAEAQIQAGVTLSFRLPPPPDDKTGGPDERYA
jgi:AraC-like DNA-binding protein